MSTAAPSDAERPRHKRPVVAADEPMIDKRAVVIALVVVATVAAGGMAWRMAQPAPPLKKTEEFQFSVSQPKPEEIKLKDPIQQIVKERIEEVKDDQKEERPNIQVSTNPVPENTTETIQTKQVDIDTPKIDPTARDKDITDAPPEATTSDDTVNALNVIAADVPRGAQLFKYSEPTPSDRPATSFVNTAPKPGKRAKVLANAFGEQEAPTMGQPGPVSINLFGNGDSFKNIDRAGALRARSAVDAALHWLAMHQHSSGRWDTTLYDGQEQGSLACTALATLAFMGAGNTTRRGEYRRHVVRGVEYILKHQKPNGRFQSKGENLYTHAICTIAIGEAFGRSHDETLHAAAQKAIDFSASAVAKDGGWRYEPNPPLSDSSVTAWFIQALKTAKMSGLKFEPSLFAGAQLYLDSLTHNGAARDTTTGIVGYEFKSAQDYTNSDSHSAGRPALTAAGIVIRRFTGVGPEARVVVKGAEALRLSPPEWKAKDFYYWYYATYAMHNMGGEHRLWWNRRIRDVLLDNQVRTGEHAGSWDPKNDLWAVQGGRVYTTALGALCLEVYYRYSDSLNAYGVAQDIDDLFLQGL